MKHTRSQSAYLTPFFNFSSYSYPFSHRVNCKKAHSHFYVLCFFSLWMKPFAYLFWNVFYVFNGFYATLKTWNRTSTYTDLVNLPISTIKQMPSAINVHILLLILWHVIRLSKCSVISWCTCGGMLHTEVEKNTWWHAIITETSPVMYNFNIWPPWCTPCFTLLKHNTIAAPRIQIR